MIKQFKFFAMGAVALLMSASAFSTVLTATTSVDNAYSIYISSDEHSKGYLFGWGNSWPTTFTDTAILEAGKIYYLNVYAHDEGWIAGFLGDFTLSGTDHTFVNGLTTLSTNTKDWFANNTGWDGLNSSIIGLGSNGVSPWDTRPGISANAEWIWAGDSVDNDDAWFTTKIYAVNSTSVPEPSSVFLMLLGLVGVLVVRRKQTTV